MSDTPVITIDGPSGAGKGTAARQLALDLGFHLLDSGAIYRAAGLHASRVGADLSSESSVMQALNTFDACFLPDDNGVRVLLSDDDVTIELRSEQTASAASKVAAMPRVRAELLGQQRSFRKPPGLVADGRDMGTVVFPDASLKVYLSASVEVRAIRRAHELKTKGMRVNMDDLMQGIKARDDRDCSRQHAPLITANDALVIDSSELDAEQVIQQIVDALPPNLRCVVN